MICIKGLDKHAVIAALHNATSPVGLGARHATGPVTADDVRADYRGKVPDHIDYYRGRPLKVDVRGDEFDAWLFDRDAGGCAAERAIATLRAAS